MTSTLDRAVAAAEMERRTMRFNINDTVGVKLTAEGRRFITDDPSLARSFKPDENGWAYAQLWFVMQVFGPHMSMGSPLLLETEIDIAAEDLREPA